MLGPDYIVQSYGGTALRLVDNCTEVPQVNLPQTPSEHRKPWTMNPKPQTPKTAMGLRFE